MVQIKYTLHHHHRLSKLRKRTKKSVHYFLLLEIVVHYFLALFIFFNFFSVKIELFLGVWLEENLDKDPSLWKRTRTSFNLFFQHSWQHFLFFNMELYVINKVSECLLCEKLYIILFIWRKFWFSNLADKQNMYDWPSLLTFFRP